MRPIMSDSVVLNREDADALRRLLQFVFAQYVYTGEDRTDFPGSVHGRTFPEWLDLLNGDDAA